MYIKKLLLINIKKIYKKKNSILFFIKNYLGYILDAYNNKFLLVKKKYFIFYINLSLNLNSFFTIQNYFIYRIYTIKKRSSYKINYIIQSSIKSVAFNSIINNKILSFH